MAGMPDKALKTQYAEDKYRNNMKIKIALFYLIVSVMSILYFNHAQAQSNHSDKQVLAMLKEFYTGYITEVANGTAQKQLLQLQKKYCTTKLLNKIPKLIEQSDADPFLKAQDSNVELLKTLTVEKDLQKDDHYIVSYLTDHKIVINLIVIKLNNNYKIDSLW